MNNGLKNSGIYDELYTPEIAVKIILPFIPKYVRTIWEPTANSNSNIVKILQKDYNVIATHLSNGEDFFQIERDADIIITNPPFSMKDEFLDRLVFLNKPFIILLPSASIEPSRARFKMYLNNRIQMLIPNFRVDYNGKRNVWFHSSWYFFKCGLKKDLNFIDVNEYLSKSDLIQDYFAKNKNKYLDEILKDLRKLLKIKDRSIKDYLSELGYAPKKRSKTDKILMNILDNYKSKEKITTKIIIYRYTLRAKSSNEVLKERITDRTVFNFYKKYPDYKNLIETYNAKIETEKNVQ